MIWRPSLAREQLKKTIVVVLAMCLVVGCTTQTMDRSRTLVQLLASNSETTESPETDALRADKLCQLAISRGWRQSLRMYEISEAEFAALPAATREARYETDMKRYGDVKRIVRILMARAQRLHAQGQLAEVDELLTCVNRLVDANSGPNVLALANVLAKGIQKRLSESGL